MIRLFLATILLGLSNICLADIYDDFVEDHLIKEPREKYISKYKNRQPPEGVDQQEWTRKTEEIEALAKKEMSKNGELFERIRKAYSSRLSPEEMEAFVEFVTNPENREILAKNHQAKQEIQEILYEYMLGEFPEKASAIMNE